jgi:hypothetical protein
MKEEQKQQITWEAFKTFARFYPVEAYESRPSDFCKFMREEGLDWTDEQIKQFVNEFKEKHNLTERSSK